MLPVLGKADQRTEHEIAEFKSRFHGYAMQNQDDQFLRQVMGIQNTASRHLPDQGFAVSAAASNDETMDASLLMNSEYMQPLVASDIHALVNHVFDAEVAAMLRHMSTKHFLRRRSELGTRQNSSVPAPVFGVGPSNTSTSITQNTPTPTQLLLQRPNAFVLSSPYLMARLSDHTQREERVAQLRLAQWATDLQKTLKDERQRYRHLQLTERKQWLIERWAECAAEEEKLQTGSAGATEQQAALARKPRRRRSKGRGQLDVQWVECGKMVLQIIGGCGILGAAAVWIIRMTGLNFEGGWNEFYTFTWWNSGD